MRSAFTDANGFPLTRTVNVSSFSDVIRLPNHDFLVNSGDDSGVRPTSSVDAMKTIFFKSLVFLQGGILLKFYCNTNLIHFIYYQNTLIPYWCRVLNTLYLIKRQTRQLFN